MPEEEASIDDTETIASNCPNEEYRVQATLRAARWLRWRSVHVTTKYSCVHMVLEVTIAEGHPRPLYEPANGVIRQR